jgi:hypothetical protein
MEMTIRYNMLYLGMLESCSQQEKSNELNPGYLKICSALFNRPKEYALLQNLKSRHFLPCFRPVEGERNADDITSCSSINQDLVDLKNKQWIMKNLVALKEETMDKG